MQKRLKGQKKEAEKKKKKQQTSKGGKGGKARKGGGKRKQQSIKGKSIQAKPSMVQPKIKASYPALFCVEVPIMSNGRIQTNELGAPMFKKEYGEYTCYHIAHHEAWKKYLYETQQETIAQLHAFVEGTPPKNKKHKKSKVT